MLNQVGDKKLSVTSSNANEINYLKDIEVWGTLQNTESNGQQMTLVVYNFNVAGRPMNTLVRDFIL